MSQAGAFWRGAGAGAAMLLGGAMLCAGFAIASYDAGFWHQGLLRGSIPHQIATGLLCLPFFWVALHEGWKAPPVRRIGWLGRLAFAFLIGVALWIPIGTLCFKVGDRGAQGDPWLGRLLVGIGLALLIIGRALSARPASARARRAWIFGIALAAITTSSVLLKRAACVLGGRMACDDVALARAESACAHNDAAGCLELGRLSLWDATPRGYDAKRGQAALERACKLGNQPGCRELAGEIEDNFAARDPGVGERRRALVAKLGPAPDVLGRFRVAETGGSALVVDADRAYVLSGRKLVGIALGSGVTTELVDHAVAMALDTDYVYAAAGLGVVRISKREGGSPELVQRILNGDAVVLAVDDQWLYWIVPPVIRGRSAPVRRAPKAGGPSQDLGMTVDFHESVGGLVVDDARLYWCSSMQWAMDDFTLYALPKAGGEAEILAEDSAGFAPSIALDGSDLYFLARGALTGGSVQHTRVDAVHRLSKSRRGWLPRSHALVTLDEDPIAVAVDEGHVYWLDKRDERNASVVRANRDGSARKVLLRSIPEATALAVTDRVYVLTKHALLAVAK